MTSLRIDLGVVNCAMISRRLQVSAVATIAIFAVAWACAPANAGPVESPNAPAVQRLVHEFDLVPNLLSAAKGKSEATPLKTLARRMTVIHQDLSQFETDEPVQTRERQVVGSIDELIAALEKKCSGLGKGHVPNGGRKESIIVSGDTAFGDLHGVDPHSRLWGQLPPKLRSEILQSKTEGFPPGYEALLQSYYQQLAEEKSLDDKPVAGSTSDAKPSDAKSTDR